MLTKYYDEIVHTIFLYFIKISCNDLDAFIYLINSWVSGVAAVYDSYVWAACLRYLHNVTLQDR